MDKVGAIHPAPAEELILQVVSSGLPRGDQKKAQILEAVVELVSEGGFEALSFEKIGNMAGAQKSQVKYHFDTKENMIFRSFQYVLAYGQQCVVAELSGSKPGVDRVHAYVKGHFRWLKARPDHLRFFLSCYARCTYDETLRDFNNHARASGRKRILGVLKESFQTVPDDELSLWSHMIHDYITGALIDIVGIKDIPSAYLQKQKQDEVLSTITQLWSRISNR